MPISAASVEDNGWVLRLDVIGSLGSFADYVLDPGGTPRVTLTSAHVGFVKSNGEAVAGSLARTMIATKPLRKPAQWTGSNLAAFVIDETDLGGGSIRVRIALSEHIYASDTGLALSVAAGWRTGEAAAPSVAVSNNSTVAAPIPIFRWALVPYSVVSGPFTVALFVASHHPVGLEPVAGVKFTATDGTNVKTVWTTELSTDASYGDDLRCYTATIDPATATALTAGLLRCDAEVYPWLGPMRTTDITSGRDMTNLNRNGYNVDATSPYAVGYDPAGTRYSSRVVFVDSINGTTTASVGMIAADLAAAKAIAPAARPRTIATALQAMALANRTLAAANGQPAATRSLDGLQVCLAEGIHSFGTGNITTGAQTAEIGVRIFGDPASSNPRANCILQSGPVSGSGLKMSRTYFANCKIELGGVGLINGVLYHHFDQVTIEGKAGQSSDSTGVSSTAPTTGRWNMAMTRCRYWRYGANISSGNTRMGIFRANEFSRTAFCYLFAARNRVLSPAEDGSANPSWNAFSNWSSATEPGQVEDCILAYNDVRYLTGRFFRLASLLPSATAGTPNPSFRRNAWIGNIVERIGSTPEPFYGLGEDTSASMTYNIIEGNSFVGERSNSFYSDPLPASLAAVDTQRNQALVNRIANNSFDWLPTKHDAFNDTTSANLRGSANGYRPQMVEAWSMLYGVAQEANVDTNRAGGEFRLEYSGPRSINGYGGTLDPRFTDDRSLLGSGGGGGDYRPRATSSLTGRGLRGNGDVDAAGRPRFVPFAAGALQMPTVDLLPQSARSNQTATLAILTQETVPTLAPVSARLPGLATSPALTWTTTLAPDAAVLPVASPPAGVALVLELRPASAMIGVASGSPGIVPVAVQVIAPDSARHQMFSNAAVPTLLPGAAIATLIIGADPRIVFPVRH